MCVGCFCSGATVTSILPACIEIAWLIVDLIQLMQKVNQQLGIFKTLA
jgi:hypothetical protein